MVFLIPFSFIYYMIIVLRNFFYRTGIFKQQILNAKVISIGNITWGGTGKTPAILFIAEKLMKYNRKIAILTRGYGNDENKLISSQLGCVPVLVDKDRVKSGKKAISEHSVDTLLLDDGFQYRKLHRNLDIVCIDATNPFGNGWMIPAGSMRESKKSLKRADCFLITRVDLVQNTKEIEGTLNDINPRALIVKSIHSVDNFFRLKDKTLVDINMFKNKEIVLLSAIGNPDSFEQTILNIGLKVKKHYIFRDHHHYKEKDLKRINNFCTENNINTVITTEKDAVRLIAANCQLLTANSLILSIKLKITKNEKRFSDRLFGIYNS